MDHRLTSAILVSLAFPLSAPKAFAAGPTIYVDRSRHALKVVAEGGKILSTSPVGLGRGGPGAKRSMADEITPAGTFHVDVILTNDPKLNAIDPKSRRLFERDRAYARYLEDGKGLSRLFANMNSLDFDGDGSADGAYGQGYIGLSGPGTGPKMSRFKKVVYWFSIALHGTPDEASAIGHNKSGGCIHLPASTLRRLISDRLVTLGTRVIVR